MTFAAQLSIVVTLASGSPAPPTPVCAPPPPIHEQHAPPRLRQSQPHDDWFGEDKLQHFFMSFATVSYGYGGARLATVEHEAALTIAIAAGAVAGFGKEIHDKRRGWLFSLKDLVWDAAGVGAAVLLLRSVR
jgi:uncharacterized protein YfiM (DUF2279 family)